WYGGDEHGPGDAVGPVPADVAGDLTASGGVSHHRDLMEIERFDHCRQVIGVGIHLVAGCGLRGPAMAPPVVRDHPEAVLREEEHLAFPRVGIQWPAVRERYGRALAP